MKVDERKIKEIARRLGVSERTVQEYLLDRLTMMKHDDAPDQGYAASEGRTGVVDRFGRRLEEDGG